MRTCYIKVRVRKGNKRKSGHYEYITHYNYWRSPKTSQICGFNYLLGDSSKKIYFKEETIIELEKFGGKNFIKEEHKIEWID